MVFFVLLKKQGRTFEIGTILGNFKILDDSFSFQGNHINS